MHAPSRTLLFVALNGVMMIYGFSVTMIGPLMPSLIGEYTLKLAGGGLVETFRNVGGVIAALAGGAVSDKLPKTRLVAVCFAGYGLSLVLIGLAPAYVLLLLLFFLLGGTTRLVDSISNALTADLYAEAPGPALNLMHTIFAVGALSGPIFSRFMLVGSGQWQIAYSVLAGICFGVLLFFLTVEARVRRRSALPARAEASGPSVGGVRGEGTLRLLRYPRMWLLSGIMFCYAGHQSGASVWLPTFMEQAVGSSSTVAAASVSFLWIGILTGRFAAISLTRRLEPRIMLSVGTLAAGLLLGIAFAAGTSAAIGVASLLAGFLTGAVVPLLIQVACGWVPQYSGSASALVFFNSSLSRTFFPWVIGLIAQSVSFQAGMTLVWAPLLLAGALAFVIPRD